MEENNNNNFEVISSKTSNANFKQNQRFYYSIFNIGPFFYNFRGHDCANWNFYHFKRYV